MAVIDDARTWFRELVNELDTSVVPNSRVDLYLQRGAEDLNRRVGWYFTDATPAVGSTGECALPVDYVETVWVYWNGQELKKADLDSWIDEGKNWRTKVNAPTEYTILGQTLILNVKPSAQALGVATLDLRYVCNPPAVSTGFPGLSTQDWPVLVLDSAKLWSEAYPGSSVSVARASAFALRFENECKAMDLQYMARRLQR